MGTGFSLIKPVKNDTKNRSFETQKPVSMGPKTGNSHARSRSQYIRILNEYIRETSSDSVLSLFFLFFPTRKAKPTCTPASPGTGGNATGAPASLHARTVDLYDL